MFAASKIAFQRATALACVLASAVALADPPTGPEFVEIGHDFPGFDYPYRAQLVVADFDGDGKDDLAFAGSTSPSGNDTTIHIVGKAASGAVSVKQSMLLPNELSPPQRLLAFTDPNDGPHLLMMDYGGMVREFSGWPLHEVRTFTTLDTPTSAAVGDIDADGAPDLVVRNETTLAAYSLATTAQKWSMPYDGGGEILLAQLDADNALEIVLGGSVPGKILDGATRTVDWSYPDSFGQWLASGHLGSPPSREFVGARDRITVFSDMPYSPLWDYVGDLYFQVNSLAVADIDGDGIDEIIFGNGSRYTIDVLDSVTHEPRASYSYGYDNAGALTTLSADGNGARQIALATASSVALIDPASGAVVWSAQSRNASLAVAAVGDVDGDGASELLTAAGFLPWDRPAGLEIRNMQSGVTEWLPDPDVDQDVYATAPYRLLVVDPIVPSEEKRILIAGTSVYDGRVLLVGGQTHEIYLKLGEYGAGPFASRAVKDAVMVDMDGDGVDDILAASEPQLSWVTGAMLHAYSQAGDLIWESVGMGSSDQRINGVLALDPALGAGDNVVAVLPGGLRAYGRLSHLLNWTMDVPNDSAFLVEHGASGAEIGIEYGNSLSFYDVPTRTLLREFTLADPIDAVKPLEGRLDWLLVSSGGRLRLIDGTDGTEVAASDFLGDHLANRDQLAVETSSPAVWRIGVGSDVGVFRYPLVLSDRIFASGMEATP